MLSIIFGRSDGVDPNKSWHAKREAKQDSIAREWKQILFKGGSALSFESGHVSIATPKLLKAALSAQFAFENARVKLRATEGYKNLRLKAEREIAFLENKAASKGVLGWFLQKPSTPEESALYSEIEKKAAYFGRTIAEQLEKSIQERRALLPELKSKIEGLERRDPDPYVDPESPEVNKLLELSEKQAKNTKLLAKHKESQSDSTVRSSIQNTYVISTGDPILDSSAKFVFMRRPKGVPDIVWNAFIDTKKAGEILDDIEEKSSIDLTSQDKKWKVDIGLEPVIEALRSHMDRDKGMKTRIKVNEEGYERVISKDNPKYRKQLRTTLKRDWSKVREMTAGVDSMEAVLFNRQMLIHILSGNIKNIPQNTVQNLGEYFDALLNSDIAKLKESYIGYAPFEQAAEFQQFLHENLVRFYVNAVKADCLEKRLGISYSWDRDLAKVALFSQDLFESYANWSENLNAFLKTMPKKVRSVLGETNISLLSKFSELLERFVKEAPPNEIQTVLRIRKEIHEKYKNDPTAYQKKMGELDAVWKNWREGKSPEEIDNTLLSLLNNIEKTLKEFAPYQVLIGAAFSSPHFQDKIKDAIGKDVELYNFYQKGVPPIWQNKAKLQLLIPELLKGTETSLLTLKLLDLNVVADEELIRNEFIRSHLAKIT